MKYRDREALNQEIEDARSYGSEDVRWAPPSAWYAIRTAPGAQRSPSITGELPDRREAKYHSLVERNLDRAGIEHFMPSFRRDVIHHRTKKWIDRRFPVFTGYCFVNLPRYNFAQVEELDGVIGFVRCSYPRLAAALKIDEAAALRSASWGAAQVLGDNFKMAGFVSVQDMVNAICEDEEHHIEAMIEFCKAAGIDDDLRRLAALNRPTTPEDCRVIAKTYNGSGYEQNGYHTKMAAAHNKWRKMPDTAWSPDLTAGPIIVPPTPGVTQDQEGFSVGDVRAIQQLLKDKGYVEVGNVDGDIGKATVSAVSAFQITQGLPVTGKVDRALWDQLKAAPMRPVSVERANATTAEVTQNAAPPIADTVKQQNLMKKVMMGVATVSGLGTILDGGVPDLDKLASTINKTQLILNTLGDKLPWVIGLGAAGIGMYAASGALGRLKDGFRKGTIR